MVHRPWSMVLFCRGPWSVDRRLLLWSIVYTPPPKWLRRTRWSMDFLSMHLFMKHFQTKHSGNFSPQEPIKRGMKSLSILLACLFFSLCGFSQQQYPLKWNIGYGTAYSYATVNTYRSFRPNRASALAAEGRWSQQWSMNTEETKLKSWENFLYNSQLYFGVEKQINKRLTLASGLEIGGRSFMLTEYLTQDGRDLGPIIETYYANRMVRSYLVTSMPILLKTSLNQKGKLQVIALSGLVFNYAHSLEKNTTFYKSKELSHYYPTLHLGMEFRERHFNRVSIDIGWQMGFSDILQDEVEIYTGIKTGNGIQRYEVESKGSHVRAGIRFYFNAPSIKKALPKVVLPQGIPPIGKSIDIALKSGPFELCIMDDQTLDDDSVKIMQDDKVLVEAIGLLKSEQCFELQLDSTSGATEIRIIALNDGRIKPNTMRVIIRQNGKEVTNEFIRTETTHSIQLVLKTTK